MTAKPIQKETPAVPQVNLILNKTGQRFLFPLWTNHIKSYYQIVSKTTLPDDIQIIDFDIDPEAGMYFKFSVSGKEWEMTLPWKESEDVFAFGYDPTIEFDGDQVKQEYQIAFDTEEVVNDLYTWCEEVRDTIGWSGIRCLLHWAIAFSYTSYAKSAK
jgi:hypothetical protein